MPRNESAANVKEQRVKKKTTNYAKLEQSNLPNTKIFFQR